MRNEWRGFKGGKWLDEVNVRDFIQDNYTPYEGDESFLEGALPDAIRAPSMISTDFSEERIWRRNIVSE